MKFRLLGNSSAAVLLFVALGCGDKIPVDPALKIPGQPNVYRTAAEEGLNPNDTYVSADMTIESSVELSFNQPVLNPLTNQMATLINVAGTSARLSVNGGYDYNGFLRSSIYFLPEPDEPSSTFDLVNVVRTVNGNYAEYGASGNWLAPGTDSYDPMLSLSHLDASLLDGFLSPTGGGGTCTQCDVAPQAKLPVEASPLLSRDGTPEMRSEMLPDGKKRVTSSLNLDAAHASQSVATAQAGNRPSTSGRQVRTYRPERDRWALERVENEATITTDRGKATLRTVARITRLSWNENKQKENERRSDRAKRIRPSASITEARTGSSNLLAPPTSPLMLTDPGGGFGGPEWWWCCKGFASNPLGDPNEGWPSENDSLDIEFHQVKAYAQPAIVLQHGIFSSAGTWNRQQKWISKNVQFSHLIGKNLPWYERFPVQAQVLHTKLRTGEVPFGQTPVIFIGHSNGGIVSRYLGQRPNLASGMEPINVRAVVTMGSPHVGGPIARYAGAMATILWRAGYGDFCPWANSGCDMVASLGRSYVRSTFLDNFANAAPLFGEMEPGSPFMQTLNSTGETYDRFGIQSSVWARWRPWHLMGDLRKGCYPEQPCGGRALARTADRTFKRLIGTGILFWLWGYWEPSLQGTAIVFFTSAGVMYAMDYVWNKATSPDDGFSDAVIPRYSQIYPNAPPQNQFEIPDGPSHVGETKSLLVRDQLQVILFDRLFIPPAQP